jgi:glycine cleavage system pyridoxal-binding protein P
MGRSGLIRVAKASYRNAHLLQSNLSVLGFQTLNKSQFYNEFLVKTPKSSKKILADLARQEICGGWDLGDDRLLICCTEMNAAEDIDDYVSAAAEKE